MYWWEYAIFIFAGISVLITIIALVFSIKHDMKLSDEWCRIFKEGGKDD